MTKVLKILMFGVMGLATMGSAVGECNAQDSNELVYLAEHRVLPQWSADGSKIVFSRKWVGVFVVEADGSRMWSLPPDTTVDGTSSLYPGNFSPAISPDGSRVAYAAVVRTHTSSDIVTSNPDGSDLRKLTDDEAIDAHPVWSPDGAQIVFDSDRPVSSDNPTSGLYIMNSDGSNLRSLDVPVRASSDYPPAWSPAGDRIAFVSVQEDRVERGEGHKIVWRDIAYTVRLDGSGLAKLGDTASTPAWSPDGTRIALVRSFFGEEEERHALYTMSPDGSDQRELLPLDWLDVQYDTLSWSPDGSEILYSSSSNRRHSPAVVVAVATSETRNVGEFPTLGGGAAWSPDGTRIAVHVNYSGSSYVDADEAKVVLYTVARDGTDRRTLVRGDENRMMAVNSNWRGVSGDVAACSAGRVVPNPDENPGLVQDCETLLGILDPLSKDAELNWSADIPMAKWTGVVIEGSPPRISSLSVARLSLVRADDTIPPELGRLIGLERLDLGFSGLTGSIPFELGNLINLRELDLGDNRLRAGIPSELGRLVNLQILDLGGNQLTRFIPPELGGLVNLLNLDLSQNQLTGPIPPELGGLVNLLNLDLSQNQLTGPIPSELGNMSNLRGLHIGSQTGSIMLTGCIPRELSTHLEFLIADGLEYC